MWISQREWERVERRLDYLEKRVIPAAPVILVKTGKQVFNGYYNEDEHKAVPVERVVQMIMESLNLRLKYDAGTPPTERVEKIK